MSAGTKKLRNCIRNTDWFLMLSCAVAAAYGIVLVYSAAVTAERGAREYLVQILAVAIGLIAAFCISLIDYEVLGQFWPVLGGVTIILMLLTLTPLGVRIPGAEEMAWINIPGINVTFQPSELAKVVFVLTFAVHLTKVRESLNHISTLALVVLHGMIPIALCVIQRENGTALVLGGMMICMMVLAGLKLVYLLFGMSAVLVCVPFVWPMISEDKQARFLCLLPGMAEKYPAAIYQQDIALKAIGSGRLWGRGFLQGGGDGLLFARNNDFVFSISGEEFGFAGAVLLLVILAVIILALLRNVMRARDLTGMLICGGVMSMICVQTFLNIGMNLSVLPVVGITLPFFSSGGSSSGTLMLAVGLAMSVFRSSRVNRMESIFLKKY